MIAIYILMSMLLVAGLLSLFGIRLREVFSALFRPIDAKEEQRRRIDKLTGKKPKRIRRMVLNAQAMLRDTNMSEKWDTYKMSSILFAVLGVTLGLAMDNIFAAVVLAPTLALAPFALIRFQSSAASNRMMAGLSTSLGVITNYYIQNADIITSVNTALPSMNSPLKEIFSEFIYTVEYVDPNVQAAVRRMRHKINNRYWRHWCDELERCQNDNGMRVTLRSIILDLGESYRMQEQLNTAINSIFAYFAMELIVLFGTPALIALVFPEYAEMLFFTIPGKIIIAVVLLVMLVCVLQLAKINKPLDAD